jgi:hypothetical protein
MPLHLKSYTETTVFGTLQVPSHFGFHLMFLRHRPLCLSGLLCICLSVFIEDPVNLNSLIYSVYTCLCPVSNPPLLISNLIQCLAYQLDLHGEAKWHSKPRSCNCRVDAKYRWYYLDLASPKLCLPFLGLTYAVMLRGYARQAQGGAYYLSVYYVVACFVYIFGMLLLFLWWNRWFSIVLLYI